MPPAEMSTRPSTARPADRLQVLAAALLFSTGGAAIKACTLSSWQVAAFRSGIAALAMLLLLPAARRGWSVRVLPVGIAYAATMICYVVGNKLTTAANTIFLQSTAPLYIMLLGPWLLGERTRRSDLAYMTALAAGMALFFVGGQPAAGTAPRPLLGNLVAAGAGLSWGLTIMGLRWLGRDARARRDQSVSAVVCGNLLACLAALPLALPVVDSRPADWLLVTFLGVFQIGVAYAFLTRGVRRVPALEVSLLLLLEPVLNPIWALLVHGERPGPWAAGGGAIIIAATAVNTLARGRPGRESLLKDKG
jgi:DME family drug/metabolite transporter